MTLSMPAPRASSPLGRVPFLHPSLSSSIRPCRGPSRPPCFTALCTSLPSPRVGGASWRGGGADPRAQRWYSDAAMRAREGACVCVSHPWPYVHEKVTRDESFFGATIPVGCHRRRCSSRSVAGAAAIYSSISPVDGRALGFIRAVDVRGRRAVGLDYVLLRSPTRSTGVTTRRYTSVGMSPRPKLQGNGRGSGGGGKAKTVHATMYLGADSDNDGDGFPRRPFLPRRVE